MAQLPRYDIQATKTAQPRDISPTSMTTAAKGAASLGDRLSSFSQKMFGVAESAAKTEAANQAIRDSYQRRQKHIAIVDDENLTKEEKDAKLAELGQAELQSGFGVYSKVYNDTAQAAYANQVRTDLKNASMLAMQEADGDPELFTSTFNSYKNKIVQYAPTKESAIVAGEAGHQYGKEGFIRTNQVKIERDKRLRQNAFASSVEIQTNDYQQALQEDRQADALKILQTLTSTLNGGVNDKFINDDDLKNHIMMASEKGILAYAKDRFAFSEEAEAKEFIGKVRDGKLYKDEFDDIRREHVANRLEYVLKVESARRENAKKTSSAIDDSYVKDFIKLMDDDEDVSSDDILRTSKRAMKPSTSAEFSRAFNDYKDTAGFRGLHPVLQQEEITKQKALIEEINKGESKEDIVKATRILKRMEARYKKDRLMMESDALNFGEKRDIIDPLPPIDIQSPDFEQNVLQRVDAAQKMNTYSGVPTGIFKKDELDNIKSDIKAMTSAEKVAFAGSLTKLPDNVKAATFNQLGGVFAVAGTHKSPLVSNQIFEGEKLLGTKLQTATKDITVDIKTKITPFLEMASAENKDAMIKAISAHMAYRAEEEGLTLDGVESDESIKAVFGEIYSADFIGDLSHDTVAPAPGVTEDQFEDWRDSLTADDFGLPADYQNRDEFAKIAASKNAQYVYAGPGKYVIKIGSTYASYKDEEGNTKLITVQYGVDK